MTLSRIKKLKLIIWILNIHSVVIVSKYFGKIYEFSNLQYSFLTCDDMIESNLVKLGQ